MSKHPLQPLEVDMHGTLRFKSNAIVLHLLNHGSIDMNQLAMLAFTREDREQFAQLIGYSLSGFGDLSYTTEEAYTTAAWLAGRTCSTAFRLYLGTASSRPKLTLLNDELHSLGSVWRLTRQKLTRTHLWNPNTDDRRFPDSEGWVTVPDLRVTHRTLLP